MTDDDRRIEWMRLDDLVPAGRNSRRHDLDGLGEAVDALGFTTELKLDENTGQLVWGHGRRDLLRRKRDAGEAPPEGVLLAEDGGDWLVPVVRGWRSRDALHADAVREADNRQHERGGYDDLVSLDILGDLAADAPDLLSGVGVSSDELDRLAAEAGGPTVTVLAPVDDDFGKPVEPPRERGERDNDEQWRDGDDPDEGSTREEPPGPLDVEPAWRTVEPMRGRYHDGTPEGADRVARWLRERSKNVHVDHTLSVSFETKDGTEYLPPGKWVVAYRGKLDVLTREEKDDEFVPANEPARRADRDAAPVGTKKAHVPSAAELLRHGKGLFTGVDGRVAPAEETPDDPS